MSQNKLKTTTMRLGTDAWGVTELWSCLNAEQAATETYLWGRTPDVPGVPGGGRFSPHAVRVERTKNYRQGMTHLTAQYRTLSNDEYMERYPPKGVVLGRSAIRMERIKYDKNGVLVSGIDPTDPTGRTVYKIVQGPETVRRNLMLYRIHAIVASKSIWVDQYTDKLGMVNGSWMGNLSRSFSSHGCLKNTLIHRSAPINAKMKTSQNASGFDQALSFRHEYMDDLPAFHLRCHKVAEAA